MTIRFFDNSTLRAVRKEMQEALQAVADKHGIGIEIQNKKLTNLSLEFETTFAIKKADGTVMTQDRSNFETHASRCGLSPSDFGREFTFKRDAYKIAGLRPGAWRFPIVGLRVRDGKEYCFPASVVSASLLPVRVAA